MKFPEPIIVLGSPRSGTSLVASIFAAHGVWTGTSREPDEGNPAYYENIHLRELRYQMGHGDGIDKETVHDCMLADGYTGGPWLVKHSPLTWRAWRQFSPTWVLVRRNPNAIYQSRERCGQWKMTIGEHRVAVDTDIAILESMKRWMGGYEVWPDLFFRGQWAPLNNAVPKFKKALAERQLKPDLWHQAG